MAHLRKLFPILSFVLFPILGEAQEGDTTLARQYLDSLTIFIDSAQYDQALYYGKKSLNIYKQVFGEQDSVTAKSYFKIGRILMNKGENEQALKYYQKALESYLSVVEKEHPEIAKTYNNIGVIYERKGAYKKALENYQEALHIFLSISKADSSSIGTCYYNVGVIFRKERKYSEAMNYYQKSLDIRLKVFGDEHPSVANTLNGIGQIYIFKGEYNKALGTYQKALNIGLKTLGKVHRDVGISYNNIGGTYYLKGEYDKALENLKKAVEIKEKILGKTNPSLSHSYQNIAVIYSIKAEYDKALEYNQKALNISLKTLGKEHVDVAYAYNNIGIIYRYKGEYDKALEYSRRALDIWTTTLGKEHPKVGTSLGNIGGIFTLKKDYDKALEYSQKALDLRLKILGEEHPEVADSYNDVGVIYKNIGIYDKALIYHQKSLNIRLKTLGEEHPDVADSYFNIGGIYILKGEYKKALEYNQKALTIRLNALGENHPKIAMSHSNIGKAYNDQGEYGNSLKHYQKALEIQLKTLGMGNPAVAESYNYIGLINYKNKEYKKAVENFENALNTIDLFYKSNNSEVSKKFYQDKNRPIFENSIRTTFEAISINPSQYDLKKTFLYTEKGKSNILLEALKNSRAKKFSEIPDSLLEQEKSLQNDIAFYDKKRQEKLSEGLSESDTAILAITSKRFEIKKQYEDLIAQFEKDFPKYFQAKYDYSTISVEDLQTDLLQRDQSLLEYFVGDSSIFIFLVQKDTFEVHEVKHDFPLEDWVREMTKEGIYGYYTASASERTRQLEEKTVVNYTNAARQLYEKLVAPVADRLTEDLIIIPDGVLGYVPFEALLTEAPPRMGAFKAYPFMVKKRQISYSYSTTLLREMQQKQHRQQPSGQLLAMAPFFRGDVSELAARIDTTDLLSGFSLRDSLNALKGSGEEVAAINKIWNGTAIYGPEASLAEFQQKAGDFRILHLSTHGKADDRVGDYAYLAFGVPGDKGTFDKLYARDLYNYSLNADMVVLSACETGIGKLQKGEGIISLARAFAYAGVKSIFTTLWQVSDEKTKDLMVGFYKYLKNGKSKDEALRLAKLDFLNDNAGKGLGTHPFFWAELIGIGDMEAIR